MNKKAILICGTLAFTSLFLTSLAGAYHLSKTPLESLLHRIELMGESQNTNSLDAFLAQAGEKSEAFLNKPILFSADTGTLQASPAELGMSHDLNALNLKLKDLENSELQKLVLRVKTKNLEIQAQVDSEVLQAKFVDSGIQQGMKNASYFYDQGVQIDPHQTGYGVEFETLAEELIELWENNSTEETQALPMRTRKAIISTALLQENLEKVKILAEQGLILEESLSTKKWTLSLKDHLDWILPDEEFFAIEEGAFLSFLRDEIAPEVEEEAKPVTISEVDGKYSFEGSARHGLTLNYEEVLNQVETAINTGNFEPIILNITKTDPEINFPDSLKEIGVTDLLGYGYSNFKGSPANRVHNVNKGMEIFSGTLLAPGEEFSFTSLMGPIDGAHGWYPELVIKGNDTIPEYGGGLCQVSSTMFRAALLTGMPITARRNHSYAVSYYAYPDGYGLDATIYNPSPDFRFVNDTSGHLLIQGYTEGTNAYFVFYGTSDGRSVKMEKSSAYSYSSISEPQITYTDKLAPGERQLESYAHTGFKIDWWRTINYADGTSSERENFHSNYQARPAKYLEGAVLESN